MTALLTYCTDQSRSSLACSSFLDAAGNRLYQIQLQSSKGPSSKMCLLINQVNAFALQYYMENNKKTNLKTNYNLNIMMETRYV